MDSRSRIAWLHRRAGFGLSAADLDAAAERGLDAELERMVDPGAHGVPSVVDPWNDADYPLGLTPDRAAIGRAIDAWLTRMVTTVRPVEEWMAWFEHGWLVSGVDKVRQALWMINQIRLFHTRGLGSLADLVTSVATDPAMLVYLDGRQSTGANPNENFSRELMELFTLGIGNYGEPDVQAGAKALTGYQLGRLGAAAIFNPRRHDDAAQTYLGRAGVHDLATVVAAITAHAAHAPFVAAKVGRAVLGRDVGADVLADLTRAYASSGLSLRALLRATLTAGADGKAGPTPVVLAPVPWLVAAQRATGAGLGLQVRLAGLRAAGQLPFLPPNVGGWPGGAAWFASSTVVARSNLAVAVAQNTAASHPVMAASAASDATALAHALALPVDFGAATRAALGQASDARSRLVVALVSPEFVLA